LFTFAHLLLSNLIEPFFSTSTGNEKYIFYVKLFKNVAPMRKG